MKLGDENSNALATIQIFKALVSNLIITILFFNILSAPTGYFLIDLNGLVVIHFWYVIIQPRTARPAHGVPVQPLRPFLLLPHYSLYYNRNRNLASDSTSSRYIVSKSRERHPSSTSQLSLARSIDLLRAFSQPPTIVSRHRRTHQASLSSFPRSHQQAMPSSV